MFIDCTRFGGDRPMRLAVASIAYLDVAPEGCAVHLIGGETLRVGETVEQIEARARGVPKKAVAAPVVVRAQCKPAANKKP